MKSGYFSKRKLSYGTLGAQPIKVPFQLVATTEGSGDPPDPRVQVVHSTLAGALPDGMDDPLVDFLLTPASGTQLVYGRITINDTTGTVTTREILQADTVPEDTVSEDTSTLFHVLIGNYVFADGAITSVSNYRYGPIDANICRNWFAAEAPFYGVIFLGT